MIEEMPRRECYATALKMTKSPYNLLIFQVSRYKNPLIGYLPKKHLVYSNELINYIIKFPDIASRGIVEVVGDDVGGRKIILISACRFPCSKVG